MPATTMSSLLDALKELYREDINQLNNKVRLLNWAETDTENIDVVGRRAYHTLRTRRSGGVGAIPIVNGTLPTARPFTRTKLQIPLRAAAARFEFDDSLQYALRSRGGFIDIADLMGEVVDEFRKDCSRQLYGTSDGVIAATGATSNSTIVVLAANTTPTQLRALAPSEGMYIDIGTVANPTAVASGLQITGIDEVNKTITVSSPVTTTTAHRIFRTGAGGAGTWTGDVNDGQKELTGLQSIIGTSTLFGIDPATVDVWKSFVDSNGGTLRAVSESMVNNAILASEVRSGMRVDAMVCSPELVAQVYELFRTNRRHVDTVQLRGGVAGIAWSMPAGLGDQEARPIGLFWDELCPGNTIYGLAAECLKWYTMGEVHWMGDDGAVLSRVPNKAAYEASLVGYMEFAPTQRNGLFAIKDLIQ